MFEKEAEKWVKENMDCCKTDNSVNQPIPYFSEEERCCAKSAFQDGAEFGYNKANEWHYVKDGDYPKKFGYFLTSLKSHAYKGFVFEVAYFTGNIFTKDGEILDNAFAWKEIVLPELKENE